MIKIENGKMYLDSLDQRWRTFHEYSDFVVMKLDSPYSTAFERVFDKKTGEAMTRLNTSIPFPHLVSVYEEPKYSYINVIQYDTQGNVFSETYSTKENADKMTYSLKRIAILKVDRKTGKAENV